MNRLSYEGFERNFFVFGCPDWCNVVAVTEEGKVVLVWQYRFGTDAMSLEVPGGVIDPGESPESAARSDRVEGVVLQPTAKAAADASAVARRTFARTRGR